MWMIWLGAALALGVVEMMIVDLIFLMFAGGALAAMVAALLGAPIAVQFVVFALVSVVLLFAVRPAAIDWMERSNPHTLTNAQALVGKSARTVLDVTNTGGRVKLQGEVWTARTARPGDVIPAGTDVVVTAIDGAIAVVDRAAQL